MRGQVLIRAYTVRNDPLTHRDRRGATTDFGSDSAGNLTSVARPDADGPGGRSGARRRSSGAILREPASPLRSLTRAGRRRPSPT
jgi:YD repeat-containing protein